MAVRLYRFRLNSRHRHCQSFHQEAQRVRRCWPLSFAWCAVVACRAAVCCVYCGAALICDAAMSTLLLSCCAGVLPYRGFHTDTETSYRVGDVGRINRPEITGPVFRSVTDNRISVSDLHPKIDLGFRLNNRRSASVPNSSWQYYRHIWQRDKTRYSLNSALRMVYTPPMCFFYIKILQHTLL